MKTQRRGKIMRSILLATVLAFSVSTTAFAQDTVLEPVKVTHEVTSPLEQSASGEVVIKTATADQVLKAFSDVVTAKNMGTLAIVFALVQGLMAWLQSAAGAIAGKWRITILIFATIIAGTAGGMIDGAGLGAAFLTSLLIIPPQITVSQLYKQYMTTKGAV
ncbi:hypothetical protein BdPhPhi1402_gp35 [Bdellovibrio phage phi1402]|uniref:hypothetical protein n=1 Tax=Bdellovibrio phage phi1402 TaxID=1035662 RepID=UPI000211A2E1|nr:hypothetical protein BdPhPhi1402_gp35 [Bdellovibrio phage phi1402]AEG42332.1 hypothetical protein [Bdellovibrio phage phi1402]